ncbi:TlpA family protein disulfide reductase [Shewanella woodyi]|uniref:TlpA family protein disulfide reductase n=1 Tax=Shewanella woodyi TaxID=60961 RepID=UPI0037479660
MKWISALNILLITLLMVGCTSSPANLTQHNSSEYQTFVKVGEMVPVTQFIDTQGEKIDLTQSHNSKLLILFATWCSDSQRAMKALKSSDLNLDPNIDIIGIGREESNETLDKFADEYELSFPLIADNDRSIYAKFANAGIPRFILLDKENQIVKTIIAEGETPLTQLQW